MTEAVDTKPGSIVLIAFDSNDQESLHLQTHHEEEGRRTLNITRDELVLVARLMRRSSPEKLEDKDRQSIREILTGFFRLLEGS